MQVDTIDINLGRLKLGEDATLLKEVTVTEQQLRVQQLGDTTQYNADAFKTSQNATTEDLITKMPGVTIENGVVKAQGEEVKKVTVDGEDFSETMLRPRCAICPPKLWIKSRYSTGSAIRRNSRVSTTDKAKKPLTL